MPGALNLKKAIEHVPSFAGIVYSDALLVCAEAPSMDGVARVAPSASNFCRTSPLSLANGVRNSMMSLAGTRDRGTLCHAISCSTTSVLSAPFCRQAWIEIWNELDRTQGKLDPAMYTPLTPEVYLAEVNAALTKRAVTRGR